MHERWMNIVYLHWQWTNSTGFSREFATFTRTKLHPVVPPPLKLVRMLLCLSTHSQLGEGLAISRSAATSVSFVAPKYQTDARVLSWYKLVTYLGLGRCVIYTASGPSALGCVNHAASYTSVCNLCIAH